MKSDIEKIIKILEKQGKIKNISSLKVYQTRKRICYAMLPVQKEIDMKSPLSEYDTSQVILNC
ncbi:MAG: hypothetical protein KJ566_00305 [Nanoarchaeota archaeon]|nr:hypothetical protein [Nanoarchaeota archaeon]